MSEEIGLRILIVDSHAGSSHALRRLLELEGYVAESADSVAAAARVLATGGIDLMICDMNLRDGCGWNLLAGAAGVRGVAVCADPDANSAALSREAGFSAYLAKPFDWETMREAIRRVTRDMTVGIRHTTHDASTAGRSGI